VVSALKPIFAGIKIPPEKKIKAIIPYLHGLSYRQVAEILEIRPEKQFENSQKEFTSPRSEKTESHLTRL